MDFRKNEDGCLVIEPCTRDEEKFLDCLLALILAWEELRPGYEAD